MSSPDHERGGGIGLRSADSKALLGGVLVSIALTAVIWVLGPRLVSIPHLPDTGADWYYWRLPESTFWGRATAWGFYLLHQIALWALIYYAQTRVRRFKTGLHGINVVLLAANGFFILLHLLQTHVWYDGLAQDVSIWTSQGSVVVLLVLILLMENSRRGLFFGKKAPISSEVVRFVRSYHGYWFAWAAAYTFWYHPTESTSAHLLGFLYMFLLLLQTSLVYTRAHTNRWWTLVLEVMVLVHGTIVAVMQGAGLWPMFGFGFAAIFVVTQMHGVGMPRWIRYVLGAAFVVAVLWVYSGRGWASMNEVIRIPLIEYLAVFVVAWLIGACTWAVRRLGGSRARLATIQE